MLLSAPVEITLVTARVVAFTTDPRPVSSWATYSREPSAVIASPEGLASTWIRLPTRPCSASTTHPAPRTSGGETPRTTDEPLTYTSGPPVGSATTPYGSTPRRIVRTLRR